MINGAISDPDHPRLSVGTAFKESIGRGEYGFIDFKIPGFDVVAVGTAKLTATIFPALLILSMNPHLGNV
jgi:hypothetical protein